MVERLAGYLYSGLCNWTSKLLSLLFIFALIPPVHLRLGLMAPSYLAT